MIIKVIPRLIKEIGLDEFNKLTKLRVSTWALDKNDPQLVNLRVMTKENVLALKKNFERIIKEKKMVSAKLMIRDIDVFLESKENPASKKAKNTRQMEALVQELLLRTNGPRVYEKTDAGYDPYYVEKIVYVPTVVNRNGKTEEHILMTLWYEEFGNIKSKDFTFWKRSCNDKTPVEMLESKALYPETGELRREYLEEMEHYKEISLDLGKQCLASGIGVTQIKKKEDYWAYDENLSMTREGKPTKVVIDVFFEDREKNNRNKENVLSDINENWWKALGKGKNVEDTATYREIEDEEELERSEEESEIIVEVPTHMYVMTFDLRKHIRVKLHSTQLIDYTYDETMSEKLILPDNTKGLVKILVEHKGGTFQDIVAGKGEGAIVLLAGPAGVGKTLTAEVYAESEKRPLYSVQCSQLGLDPESLEENLNMAFEKAKRWKAILLLDEADVYVKKRGGSLEQNAIVGVFLRMLEYQNTVLFMTTNRPEDVDDAVASRCIAKLIYKTPSVDDQKKIWRVLADQTSTDISDKVIGQIAEENPKLSGRDVKNLLKLAKLVSEGTNEKISNETISYVKQFKPTEDII